jgi:hypothetical protein
MILGKCNELVPQQPDKPLNQSNLISMLKLERPLSDNPEVFERGLIYSY